MSAYSSWPDEAEIEQLRPFMVAWLRANPGVECDLFGLITAARMVRDGAWTLRSPYVNSGGADNAD